MSNTSNPLRIGVIMAGGSGERFWPLSRRLRPKQLLPLASPDCSLLEEAVSRIAPLIPPEQVLIVTGEHLVDPIRRAQVGVPDANVLAEPCKRNTAGALAFAAAHLLAKYPIDPEHITMAVLTADHRVIETDRFVQTVRAAIEAAEREHALATLGVVPTRPETGYGYIQIAKDPEPVVPAEEGPAAFRVQAFREKPSREQAEDFIATGQYFWNSGMFFWTLATFLSELDRARPALAQAVLSMAEALRASTPGRAREIFEGLDDISIDYALMERAQRVLMVRADFTWDDVGAWPSLERTHGPDKEGNVLIGDPVVIDSKSCIVYNEVGAEAMAVGVVGVEGLVVVVTTDAVLVIPKDRAQDVRHAVREFLRRGARQV